MKTNPLGRTGLAISEIAFGGGVTGGILIKADEATLQAALARAAAGGINWIYTAALYGDGASEETIGRHLSSLMPRPHISTKIRLERDNMADVPGAIERGLTQSLRRLRVESVALFQLHNQLGESVGGRPSLSPNDVLRNGGVADTFDRLKAQGLFRAGGLTAAGDTSACIEVIDSGRFDAAQIYYNAINPSAAWTRAPAGWKAQDFSGVIAACRRHHMGMLNIRVFAGGPLARAQRPERLAVLISGTDVDNEVRCAAAVRAALGDAYGTPAQTALRFVLANADLSSRVIGIAALADLDDAFAAVAQGPLPGAAVAKLEDLWANDFR
jgi:L-galactose dehydrogenase/L-glyceraldehyde 3-phosphate reductase